MTGGNSYVVRLTPTAQTAAKTLLQVKAGLAPLEILSVRLHQITRTATEGWAIQILRKTVAATVTSFTALRLNFTDPVALAVGGTAATGVNATVEGTDGEIVVETTWNVINDEWVYLPVPEERIWVPQAGILALKLATNPSASSSIGASIIFREYQ